MATIPADHLKLIFSFVTKNSFALFAPVCKLWRAAFGDDVLTDPEVAMEGDLYTINADLFTKKGTILRHWNASCHIQALLDYFPMQKCIDYGAFATYGNVDALNYFFDNVKISKSELDDIASYSAGNIPVIRWLNANGNINRTTIKPIIYSAAMYGRVDAINHLIACFGHQWILHNDGGEAYAGVICSGKLDRLDELNKLGFVPPSRFVCIKNAIASNNVDTAKIYIADDEQFSDDQIEILLKECAIENADKTFKFLCKRYPDQIRKTDIYFSTIELAIRNDGNAYIDALVKFGCKLRIETLAYAAKQSNDPRTYSRVLGHLYAQDVKKRQREDGDDNYTRKRQRTNDSASDSDSD